MLISTVVVEKCIYYVFGPRGYTVGSQNVLIIKEYFVYADFERYSVGGKSYPATYIWMDRRRKASVNLRSYRD